MGLRLCSGGETVEKAATAKCGQRIRHRHFISKHNSSIFIKLQCFILLKVGRFGEESGFEWKVPEGLKASQRQTFFFLFLTTQTHIFFQKRCIAASLMWLVDLLASIRIFLLFCFLLIEASAGLLCGSCFFS